MSQSFVFFFFLVCFCFLFLGCANKCPFVKLVGFKKHKYSSFQSPTSSEGTIAFFCCVTLSVCLSGCCMSHFSFFFFMHLKNKIKKAQHVQNVNQQSRFTPLLRLDDMFSRKLFLQSNSVNDRVRYPVWSVLNKQGQYVVSNIAHSLLRYFYYYILV